MSRLELNEESRKDAMRLFNEGKNADFNLDAVLDSLYQVGSHDHDLLRFFIEIQLEAAVSDGELQPVEQQLLLYICQRLHFSSQEFQQLWARQWASQAFHQWYTQGAQGGFGQQGRSSQSHSQSQNRGHYSGHYQRDQQQNYSRSRNSQYSLQDAYGVLGVAPTAAPADIKKAYRRLMNQHHPDKLASRGLPEHMMKLAKEKTQQISAAYEIVREARGFR